MRVIAASPPSRSHPLLFPFPIITTRAGDWTQPAARSRRRKCCRERLEVDGGRGRCRYILESPSPPPLIPLSHILGKRKGVSLSLLRLLLLLLDSNRPLPSSTVGRAYEQSLTHPPPPPPPDHSHHLPFPPPLFRFPTLRLPPPAHRLAGKEALSLSVGHFRSGDRHPQPKPSVGRSKWPDDDAGCSDGSQTQKTKGDFSIDDGLDVSQNLRFRRSTMFSLKVV